MKKAKLRTLKHVRVLDSDDLKGPILCVIKNLQQFEKEGFTTYPDASRIRIEYQWADDNSYYELKAEFDETDEEYEKRMKEDEHHQEILKQMLEKRRETNRASAIQRAKTLLQENGYSILK